MSSQIPSAMSNKTLQGFLKTAALEEASTTDAITPPKASEWLERVSDVLQEVEDNAAQVAQGRTAEQMMALGSFRTHLLLSLQALKAAQ